MNELALTTFIDRRLYNDTPVLTLKDIDRIHRRPDGTAKRNFKNNRDHFVEGTDFFHLKAADFQKDENRPLVIPSRGLLVFTLTGYLMIVKSFTDDLSWAIQRELVNGYFAARRAGLTFMGTPVITPAEAARALGITADAVIARMTRKRGRFGMGDALMLEGPMLAKFKRENNMERAFSRAMWIISASGFEKLKQA